MKKKSIKEKSTSLFNLPNIILLVVFLIISLTFFILLNSQQGTGFGFSEIMFSIVFSIITTVFLLWIKTFIQKNSYLGSVVGFIILIVSVYALYLKYTGIYTIIFSIITSIIILVYLGYCFFKALSVKTKAKEVYYDDNPID